MQEKDAYIYTIFVFNRVKIYNWAFSAKSAVKIALEMAGYWPGFFWQTSWPPYWCTKQ